MSKQSDQPSNASPQGAVSLPPEETRSPTEAQPSDVLPGTEQELPLRIVSREEAPLLLDALKEEEDLAPEPEPIPEPELPKPTIQIPLMSEARRNMGSFSANNAGVTFNPKTDDCFHLNGSSHGGVCTIQGMSPCPYLGGNCESCSLYKNREKEIARRKGLPPAERYRLDAG